MPADKTGQTPCEGLIFATPCSPIQIPGNQPFPSCLYCGGWHIGQCPRVKAIEYFENGTIKRIEFHDGYGSITNAKTPGVAP